MVPGPGSPAEAGPASAQAGQAGQAGQASSSLPRHPTMTTPKNAGCLFNSGRVGDRPGLVPRGPYGRDRVPLRHRPPGTWPPSVETIPAGAGSRLRDLQVHRRGDAFLGTFTRIDTTDIVHLSSKEPELLRWNSTEISSRPGPGKQLPSVTTDRLAQLSTKQHPVRHRCRSQDHRAKTQVTVQLLPQLLSGLRPVGASPELLGWRPSARRGRGSTVRRARCSPAGRTRTARRGSAAHRSSTSARGRVSPLSLGAPTDRPQPIIGRVGPPGPARAASPAGCPRRRRSRPRGGGPCGRGRSPRG